ncbi:MULTISPECIES: hypothetical protein [unclassified Crossiella]|uniref:terpene synthase family protein n=1 Tax=unclassified Crossiella TaxID=2620835 RepID=UPI001FFFB3CA|nr:MULTISPECIES: hypothetical protein [unclassified Crossiella]MCK2244211.1 hypothetical protein [Crossiella sp. S99.2]MCK2258015.1 hypothetical protein [Crossiella sp. S99.1]
MTDAPADLAGALRLDPPAGHPLLDLPSAISPHLAELEAGILDWADRYALLDGPSARDKLARTRLGELIARSYPTIAPARIPAVTGWFTWAFVIDDCHEQPSGDYDAAAARTMDILAGAPGLAGATPLEAQLSEVWQRLSAGMSTSWRHRFALHMAHFLVAFKYEAFNRRHRQVPDLGWYRQFRRSSGGITPSLDLIEVATGQEVPALLHEFEETRLMFNRAADVVVWVNDIVSLRKELAAGEVSNGVLVLARERDLDLQTAVDETYVLIGRQLAEFHQAEAEAETLLGHWRGLEPAAVDAVRTFADGLRSWMRGNLDWSAHSDRYQVTDGIRLATVN